MIYTYNEKLVWYGTSNGFLIRFLSERGEKEYLLPVKRFTILDVSCSSVLLGNIH